MTILAGNMFSQIPAAPNIFVRREDMSFELMSSVSETDELFAQRDASWLYVPLAAIVVAIYGSP